MRINSAQSVGFASYALRVAAGGGLGLLGTGSTEAISYQWSANSYQRSANKKDSGEASRA